MKYKAFYKFYDGRGDVPASAPIEAEIKDLFYDVFPNLEWDGDFVGLIDANDNTLQVTYDRGSDHFLGGNSGSQAQRQRRLLAPVRPVAHVPEKNPRDF